MIDRSIGDGAGLRDNRPENVTTQVNFLASSADPSYNKMARNLTAINLDIRWPQFVSFSPQVSPMLGQRVQLVGGTQLSP